MSDKIRDLECMVATTVTAIVNNRRFIEWKAYIDMVFKDIISGTGEGRISPALITKDNVKMILEENSTLNTSAMRDHPTMIYEFGKMYVAKTNVDTDSFNAHLILKVPILKSEEIYPLYDVHHTGIREGNGCLKFTIPERVYFNESFYSYSGTGCETRAKLHICPITSQKSRIPCLMEDSSKCEAQLDDCGTRIVHTQSGVLIRTDEEVKATDTNPNGKLKSINKTEQSTVFLNYTNSKEVLVGEQLLRGVDSPILSTKLGIGDGKRWKKLVTDEKTKLEKYNIPKLHATLQHQEEIIANLGKIGTKLSYSTWRMIVVTIVLSVITSLLTELAIWMVKKWRKRNNKKEIISHTVERKGLKRFRREMEEDDD